MTPQLITHGRPMDLELLALESLPCGCVAGDFRALPLDVEIVSIEAKGPHCNLHDHRVGQTLEMADMSALDEAMAIGEILDALDRPEADEPMS